MDAQEIIEALEERLEDLKEQRDIVKEDDEFRTKEVETTKFSPIHSDDSLEAFEYEISRIKKLKEKDWL